ncbi:MAG: glycine--tRNA ligase subunit beta, partial [Proteobacteria bacterium]
RYFCLEKPDGSLLPQYLSVVNTALDPARIAKGQDRVMRARLSDAAFFFAEDKKVDLESRVEKLSGIVFHVRLGTVREKVARIERLAVLLAKELGASDELASKVHLGAHLCKFDLVSLMVGEFPELQGEMGRAYALARGLDAEVAGAVSEHYKPIGAEGELPAGLVATCVALADRLDTLAGCFAVGLEPTGTADPYALRRNDIAVLRFFLDAPQTGGLEKLASLDLGTLFGLAYDGLTGIKLDLDRDAAVKKLLGFSYDRLRNLLAQRTSSQAADVALAGAAQEHAAYPALAAAKAKAIHAASGEAWLAKAKLVAKRLAGISKDAKPVLHPAELFTREEDGRIVRLVHSLDEGTRALTDAESVRRGLVSAEHAATELDAIFEGMLVNDPADPRTKERLELLSFGASCMLRLGDFTKLG